MRRLFPHPGFSLQRRLALALAGCVTACWLAGTVAAGLVLREEISEVFDSALQEVAQGVLPLAYAEILERGNDGPPDTTPNRIASVGPHREYIAYVVRDASGRVLLMSHDADLAAFPTTMQPGFVDGPVTRLYTEAAVQGTLFVTTAERPGHRRTTVLQATRMLVLPLVVLLPLVAAVIWILVARSFQPIGAFQRAIEARGGGNLTPVDTSALPVEITPAAEAVNRLIERLRQALEGERRFTANSAHELRTPVAAALAQTQRLLAELPGGPSHDRAAAIEAALRRLTRLSEKLLQLAKAESGSLMADRPQDLVPALTLVLSDLQATPGSADRLVLEVPDSGRLLSPLDIDAFAVLARNLIENAVRHGDTSKPVRVSLTADGLFSVTNSGRVVPADILALMTKPFQRGNTDADGAGIGLAIVAAIAAGIGTRLQLRSPAPGMADGFEATVTLPKAES